VARTVGQLLTWTIHCISKERELIREQQFEDPMRSDMAEQLLVMAKDMMVFAGMVRYKLPPRVFETLARAGMDAGAY
jgi:nuclear pore complex protein Nup93